MSLSPTPFSLAKFISPAMLFISADLLALSSNALASPLTASMVWTPDVFKLLKSSWLIFPAFTLKSSPFIAGSAVSSDAAIVIVPSALPTVSISFAETSNVFVPSDISQYPY